MSITLAPDFEKRLEDLAAETRRDKGSFVREILERGLEDVEDYYLGVEALRRVRDGEEKTYSAAEVRRELGLED
jgi:RHH-type rel operon transcriptional repressor/antitoxin RelB